MLPVPERVGLKTSRLTGSELKANKPEGRPDGGVLVAVSAGAEGAGGS